MRIWKWTFVAFVLLELGFVSSTALAQRTEKPISILSSTDTLLLGVEKKINLKVKLPPKITKFNFQCLYGKIENINTRKRGRIIIAEYVPPQHFFPSVDILVISATDGEKVFWGTTSIELIGQGKAKIVTTPNATTHVRIGKRKFGPVTADETGEAYIDVQVPPGVTHGQDDEGNQVDLQVPPLPLGALFTAHGDQINVDETTEEELLFITLDPNGKPGGNIKKPTCEADLGEVTEHSQLSKGVYRARWIVQATSQKVVFTIYNDSLEGIHSKQIEIVGAEDFEDTAVAVEVEEPVAPPKPVVPPKPVQIPPGQERLMFSLLGGLNFNFSEWLSPSIKLSVVAKVLKNPIVGIGAQIGYLHEREQKSVNAVNAVVTSESTIIPINVLVWLRKPIFPKWYITPTAELGVAIVNHYMTLPTIEDPSNNNTEEKKAIFNFGAGVSAERELGMGLVAAQLGAGFYNENLATLQGKLFVVELLVGYRFAPRSRTKK